MTQHMLNVILPFRAELAPVHAELSTSWGNPLRAPLRSELDRLELIHFMGIHALQGAPLNHLVMELSVDGSPEHVLEQLSQRLAEPLTRLLRSAGLQSGRALGDYLLAHRQPVGLGWFETTGLNYPGTPGLSVRRIRAEAQLAEHVSQLVEQMTHLPQSPLQKLCEVRQSLWSDGTLKWAFEEQALLAEHGAGTQLQALYQSVWPLIQELAWPLLVPPLLGSAVAGALAGPLSALGASTALLVLELAWLVRQYRRFREQEQSDVAWTALPDPCAMREIGALEDRCTQNHLIVLSELKGGWLRRLSLRLALFAVRQAVVHLFAPGKLGDISTIHFARWIVLPRTSQLLFLSNYGGSWDSYLEDFIVKAHLGLTGVWSNTLGFPKAHHLFGEGATHGAQFKAWARRQQQPTRAWYSAYPQLTTARIRTNAAIRQGIAAAADEPSAQRWLALFGAKRPEAQDAAVERAQLPALVFGGLPRLAHAKAWLLRFRTAERAKRWLADVHEEVAFGEDSSRTRVLALAFSARGLQTLGVSCEALASFPVEFRLGPAARAQKLGDVGKDAPEHWDWGSREDVDVIALLYAHSPEALDQLQTRAGVQDETCFAYRHEVRFQPRPQPGELAREPFGFIDGISQPVLRGTSKAAKTRRVDQIIEPGEVILGYRDESAQVPRAPRLSTRQATDLGRNGTYLVVRQLKQEVAAFHAFCERAALDPEVLRAKPANAPARDWVAAKLVGRWPNGSSLVRYPDQPGPDFVRDNDFRYGAEDPDGLACPYGAHTRRANPRDSFAPEADKPLQITNRHRLLRVGRAYEHGDERGLMFMCLNADIARQFEFVQQTWLHAQSFHGLARERDPLLSGETETMLTVPTAQGPVCLRGIHDFVSLLGAGYFFMPGRECLRFLAERALSTDNVRLPSAAE